MLKSCKFVKSADDSIVDVTLLPPARAFLFKNSPYFENHKILMFNQEYWSRPVCAKGAQILTHFVFCFGFKKNSFVAFPKAWHRLPMTNLMRSQFRVQGF